MLRRGDKLEKLSILVCENYIPEFEYLIKNERLQDIELVTFPAFCDGGFSPDEIAHNPAFRKSSCSNAVLFCGKSCPAPRKASNKEEWFQTIEYSYCYSKLTGDQFCCFFAEEGYYVVTLGWLNNWSAHLERQGFDQKTAQEYYKSWCYKLLYLDSGIDKTATEKLDTLSAYLEIPSQTIAVNLDSLGMLVKDKLYAWKLKKNYPNINKDNQIRGIQEQNANNAAALHIISRIATAGYKRDVVSMLEEFWLLIFGATQTHYWPDNVPGSGLPDSIKTVQLPQGQSFILDEEATTLYAPLKMGEKNYGVFEAGGFLFPQNISKYKDLFNSVINIAALAISNANRYEDLIASRNQYEHLSYHDDLTGLYNRSYYNKLCSTLTPFHPGGVFVIDVDGLKIVNDTHGHSAGDALIRAAANTLVKTFRETDAAIRIGGDEFVVIVKGCDQQQAETLLRRLHQKILVTDTLQGGKLSMSTGYSVTESIEDNLEEMVRLADHKMYEQKQKNKALSPRQEE